MALNAQRLSSSMQQAMFQSLGASGSEMSTMCDGISKGFVSNITQSRGTIIGGGAYGSVAIGLFGIAPEAMANNIVAKVTKAIGAEGSALKPMAKAISKAVVQELALATIMGTDAGVAKSFMGANGTIMGKAMLRAMGYDNTGVNEKFFIAIATALIDTIEKSGQAIIPPSSPGGGPHIASLS